MTPHEQLADLAKATPPLAITGMTILGFPMSDWVLLLTAIYTALQIFLVVRRMLASKRVSDTCTVDCPARQK